MAKRKTLYLIDGSSYIFRAFFGIRQQLSTSKGFPTNALYGFTNMLQKVIRDEQPDYLAVAFDSPEKTFRHKIYPEYKANRDEPPEDLAQQFPYFEPLVKAFGIAGLRQPGFEADDIIGTLAKKGEEDGMEVTIVSGDKDMMQLISPHIHMLDTMKNKRFTDKEVVDKFGVGPDHVIEVMGLMGDASDHIPGVSGVGPKTAGELIQKFGSIQNLYERLDEIDKKKLKEKLERDKDNAFLSKKLVTIDRDMDLECDFEDMKAGETDKAALRKMFEEFEFKSFLAEMEDSAAPASSEVDRSRYETILTEKDFDRLLKNLKKKKSFALDLETTSKRPVWARMVGISFSFEEGQACYLPLTHRYLGVPDQLNLQKVCDRLKPILEDMKIKKCGQNIKYDLIVLANEGIHLKGIDFDTMIASYLLNPSSRGHGLDDLAMAQLGHQTLTYKEMVGTGKKEIGFDEVEIERATEYAAEDSDITWRLMRKLRPQLTGETLKLFNEIELPLLEVLAEMEMNGVYIDRKHLAELSSSMDKQLRQLETRIYSLAGETFNINSPKQLSVILFEKLKLPVKKKTKTGYSTDVSVLEELADDHELPEKILSYRQLAKLKSTYVDALPEEIFSKSGRVHTSFNQTVAATGRLSSSNPNLQNIPIRSEMGKEIRKAFSAEGDGMLLSADYSQIELRILAHLSGDEALKSAFARGEDIHTRTAAEIFGSSLEDVDEERRRMAKAVNFGIVYGLSSFGLSRQLKISPREAKDFIDQYFNLYKRVKEFMDTTIAQARETGYTLTLFNRRRYLPDLNSKNRQVREGAERVAINSPIQGSAADLIKVAMIRLSRQMAELKLKSKMILQVHDELVFECPVKEKDKMESLARKEMEGACSLSVPLVVDMGWGKNWSEAH
ncbi:DNA polymerase I [Candidatus Nitromaritima sp. SCGC AAA799-C22]|nr:DNA polymerase I [Candidatus Nitromaritima sp. SCGC AAA799-C22]